MILSSDVTGGSERLRREFAAIAEGETDIVIGTQLVAKGHNFPLLTLVGVVDADLGLAHGDLRAAERTFQLLAQVTGRAGRAGGQSRAFLQTRTRTIRSSARSSRATATRSTKRRSRNGVRRGCRRSAPPRGAGRRQVPTGRRRRATRRRSAAPRRPATRLRCSGRPRRRSRWCAAAPVSVCWYRRRAAPISRGSSAPGSQRVRPRTAHCGSRSTSIRRVFCSPTGARRTGAPSLSKVHAGADRQAEHRGLPVDALRPAREAHDMVLEMGVAARLHMPVPCCGGEAQRIGEAVGDRRFQLIAPPLAVLRNRTGEVSPGSVPMRSQCASEPVRRE